MPTLKQSETDKKEKRAARKLRAWLRELSKRTDLDFRDLVSEVQRMEVATSFVWEDEEDYLEAIDRFQS